MTYNVFGGTLSLNQSINLSWGGVRVFWHPLTPPEYCHGLVTEVPSGVQRQSTGWGFWTGDKVPRSLSIFIKLILNKIVQTLSFKLVFSERDHAVIHCRFQLSGVPWRHRSGVHRSTSANRYLRSIPLGLAKILPQYFSWSICSSVWIV